MLTLRLGKQGLGGGYDKMATSKIVELIKTESTIGSGKDGDPFRRLDEYFEKDGTLVFSRDAWLEAQMRETQQVYEESRFNPDNAAKLRYGVN